MLPVPQLEVAADQIRGSDVLARLGGEEFAILMPQTTLEQAIKLAERLRKRLEGLAIHFEGKVLGCTGSFGVSHTSQAGVVLDALLASADYALYQAKHAGRNSVCSDPR